MDFVDDIDLFTSDAGSKIDLVPQLTDVIDGGIGCRVDLDQVQKLAAVHSQTVGTVIAGPVFRILIQTVDSPGKDPGDSCFACSPRTGKEICMSDTVRPDRILQDPSHLILIYNVVPNLRTVLSV